MKGLVSHSLMIIAIISSLTSISFGMKFNYDVEPNQMQCIGEYLTENTVGNIHIITVMILISNLYY